MDPFELPDALRVDMLSSLRVLQARELRPGEWDLVAGGLAALTEALEKGNPSLVQQALDDIDALGPTRTLRIPSQSLGTESDEAHARPPDQVLEYLNRIIHAYESPPASAHSAGA